MESNDSGSPLWGRTEWGDCQKHNSFVHCYFCIHLFFKGNGGIEPWASLSEFSLHLRLQPDNSSLCYHFDGPKKKLVVFPPAFSLSSAEGFIQIAKHFHYWKWMSLFSFFLTVTRWHEEVWIFPFYRWENGLETLPKSSGPQVKDSRVESRLFRAQSP